MEESLRQQIIQVSILSPTETLYYYRDCEEVFEKGGIYAVECT